MWQLGSSARQVHITAAGREREGGLFLSSSQGPPDTGPRRQHSQGTTHAYMLLTIEIKITIEMARLVL